MTDIATSPIELGLGGRRCLVIGDGPLREACAQRLASLGATVAQAAPSAASWDDATRTVSDVAERWGAIDVLVTIVAATRPHCSFLTQDPAEMTDTVDRLFFGTVAVVRSAIDVMAPGGRVVQVVSHTGSIGAPGAVVHDSCQAAVQHLARNLAQELPDLGLTVVTVATGLVDDSESELLSRHALGRLTTSGDVAGMVAVAASTLADDAHGSVLGMTGGLE